MADVFPPRDLPGRAEEWGRQVERRIENGESSEEQLEQKVDNGLRATGGQLAVLSQQLDRITEAQEDLYGRVSFGTFWSGSPISVSSNVSGVDLPGLTTDFSVDEPRVIKAQTTMEVSLFRGSGAASALAQLSHRLNHGPLDSSQSFPTHARSPITNETLILQLTVSSLFSVAPGSHSINLYYGTNVTPNGFVVFTNGVTTVDVLQRA